MLMNLINKYEHFKVISPYKSYILLSYYKINPTEREISETETDNK